MQQRIEPVKLFTNQSTIGDTTAYLVQDRKHVFFQIATAGSANFTIKFKISNQLEQPNFAAAASKTNAWSYVQVKNLITNSAVDGATWVSFSGTDGVINVEVNTNGQRWVWAEITAISAGNTDLVLSAKNNQ